jgi:CRP/FNR family transcriptional regulator
VVTNLAEFTHRVSQCTNCNTVSCTNCRLASICLPIALEVEDIARLDQIILRSKPLAKGEYVFKEKQPFNSVYAVRSGSIKTSSNGCDGSEQVTGFYFPGEIFGIEGISNHRHAGTAIALETSSICEIPFERLEELSASIPRLLRHFFKLMSREIVSDQQLIRLLSKSSADERVAALLVSISRRKSRLRLSATEFRLTMTRSDIGNYLGLTLETVSRILGRLQKEGMLAVNNKDIEITDYPMLESLACIEE